MVQVSLATSSGRTNDVVPRNVRSSGFHCVHTLDPVLLVATVCTVMPGACHVHLVVGIASIAFRPRASLVRGSEGVFGSCGPGICSIPWSHIFWPRAHAVVTDRTMVTQMVSSPVGTPKVSKAGKCSSQPRPMLLLVFDLVQQGVFSLGRVSRLLVAS